jgi:hypothetical protein
VVRTALSAVRSFVLAWFNTGTILRITLYRKTSFLRLRRISRLFVLPVLVVTVTCISCTVELEKDRTRVSFFFPFSSGSELSDVYSPFQC